MRLHHRAESSEMYVGSHEAGVDSETYDGGKHDVEEQENKQQVADKDAYPAFSSQPGHLDPRDPLNWNLSLKVFTVLILTYPRPTCSRLASSGYGTDYWAICHGN